MGWLFMQSMGGFSSPKTYLDNQCTYTRETVTSKVLKSSMVGSTYYAAVEQRPNVGERSVYAVVCLTKHTPRGDREGYVFGYKDMDESCGPVESQCPVSILDLLTPTDSKWALEWRERCRAYAAKQRDARSKPKLTEGQKIQLETPLSFTDGTKHSRFLATRLPRTRGLVFKSLETGGFYRISKLMEMPFSIIS